MRLIALFGLLLGLTSCGFLGLDPAPEPSYLVIEIPVSTNPVGDCWILPDTTAPKAAQAFTSGVWCEKTRSHHKDCAACSK